MTTTTPNLTTLIAFIIDTDLRNLMDEVYSATEELDIKQIETLKPQVNALKRIYPNHEYIANMVMWLEEVEEDVKKLKAYEQLLIDLYPGNLNFLRNEYYKGQDVSEEFLQDEARAKTESDAHMFVYQWGQY